MTGACGVLGTTIVKYFASQGVKMVLLDLERASELGEKIVSEIKADGGEACFLATDVLDKAVLKSTAQFYAAHREPEPQQTLFDMENKDDFLYEPEDYDEYEPDEDEQAMDESDPFYFSEGMHL